MKHRITCAEKKLIWLFETRAAPEKAAAQQKDVYLENEAEEGFVQTLFVFLNVGAKTTHNK